MALLEVNNLTVRFYTRDGVTTAVDNVSFNVDRGQILGIVGESGSGKSVCCYSLLNLIPQPPGKIESGTANFEGVDLLASSEAELRAIRGDDVAMIFQDPMTSLNPFLTIGEQLIEPLIFHRNYKRSQARVRAKELLDEVGIQQVAERFDSYPHEFSGGMRQRVMIAMALINEPKLLIADEPTTALDVTIQAQILELIAELQKKRNIGVIFISHDLGVVANIADNVLVMKEGKVVESGTAKQLFSAPKEEYTRQLIDSIPSGSRQSDGVKKDPIIQVRDLHTWFKDRNSGKGEYIKAVNGVTFDIQRGEILGLVGESGSGKSTIGRSILKLVPVTAGEVLYQGQNLVGLERAQMKPLRRQLQMIFQDPYASLNPRMTVYDALAEPMLYHGVATAKDIDQKVLTLMDDVGLERRYIRKYPHEFSGGQRQRIAIGRAIACNPGFLVADEPVSALDVTIQAQILDLLIELVKNRNLTMLFISHDLSVVRYLCDRTLVMQRGELVEQGDTDKMFTAAEMPYTRELLGAIPQIPGHE
ncbi:MAG: ABC transporter ATP-binding protein [Proteobacteria bacterium]|jgi:oligopeptide transport system ATP-binding protein|nr:ABC transporter ATP-binding protein [Pseudomonadota bacterium]